jgi:hypothetical protein
MVSEVVKQGISNLLISRVTEGLPAFIERSEKTDEYVPSNARMGHKRNR